VLPSRGGRALVEGAARFRRGRACDEDRRGTDRRTSLRTLVEHELERPETRGCKPTVEAVVAHHYGVDPRTAKNLVRTVVTRPTLKSMVAARADQIRQYDGKNTDAVEPKLWEIAKEEWGCVRPRAVQHCDG